MWISLIGFMGSGKSRLASLLGELAVLSVVDLDARIVAQVGRSVGELFAAEGEAAFRTLELQTLASLPAAGECVLACGGGIVETPEAVRLLRERGPVIWLDVTWGILRRRLAEDAALGADRPLVEALDWSELEALYHRRQPLYATAADYRLRGDLVAPEILARRAVSFRLDWTRSQGIRT